MTGDGIASCPTTESQTMFIITKDLIDEGRAIGVIGPRCATESGIAALKATAAGKRHPDAIHFKMFDDDGEHYYSGYYIDAQGSDEFEPLDCFGGPNAGCTSIKVRGADGRYSTV